MRAIRNIDPTLLRRLLLIGHRLAAGRKEHRESLQYVHLNSLPDGSLTMEAKSMYRGGIWTAHPDLSVGERTEIGIHRADVWRARPVLAAAAKNELPVTITEQGGLVDIRAGDLGIACQQQHYAMGERDLAPLMSDVTYKEMVDFGDPEPLLAKLKAWPKQWQYWVDPALKNEGYWITVDTHLHLKLHPRKLEIYLSPSDLKDWTYPASERKRWVGTDKPVPDKQVLLHTIVHDDPAAPLEVSLRMSFLIDLLEVADGQFRMHWRKDSRSMEVAWPNQNARGLIAPQASPQPF